MTSPTPRITCGRGTTLERRREETLQPHGRGVRRLLRVHRCPDRAASSTIWRSTGQLDNTLVFYAADNGASGEGTPERLGQREQVLQRLPRRPRRESDDTSTSSAGPMPTTTTRPAGRSHSRHRSRCSSATRSIAGGTCDPLIIPGRKGIKASGEMRHQYHHSTDIVPTILDAVGLEMPDGLPWRGAVPAVGRVDALQLRREPDGPTTKKRQYFAMLGTRGIWEDGWKAAAIHAPITGQGHFDEDKWELYHVDEDRADPRMSPTSIPRSSSNFEAWIDEAEELRAAPRRPHRAGNARRRAPAERAAPRAVHLLPGHHCGS